jgi:hypothetical protein
VKFDESRLAKWSEAVRAKYGKCQKCGSHRNLHAHHIKQKSIHPKYAYTISNGTCLCRKCHMDLHKKIGFGKHSFDEVMSWHKDRKNHKKQVEYRNKPIRVVYKPRKLKYSRTKYHFKVKRR